MSTQWFCRIMGEVWGPMSALELYTVARRGRLSRDDFVRNGFNGEWTRAETVHGLFDEPNPSTGARQITVPVRRGPMPRPASRYDCSSRANVIGCGMREKSPGHFPGDKYCDWRPPAS